MSTEILPPTPTFTADSRGLTIHADIPFEDWLAIGDQLAPMAKSLGFILGDWLNYGESRYGEKYAEAITATGLAYQTLANYAWVAKRVGVSARTENLDFKHHQVVAKLKDPDEQRRWLETAAKEQLSAERLRRSLNFGRVATEEEMRPDPADRGKITYLALINRIVRWWKSEVAKAPPATWDEERRNALREDFRAIREIHDALQ